MGHDRQLKTQRRGLPRQRRAGASLCPVPRSPCGGSAARGLGNGTRELPALLPVLVTKNAWVEVWVTGYSQIYSQLSARSRGKRTHTEGNGGGGGHRDPPVPRAPARGAPFPARAPPGRRGRARRGRWGAMPAASGQLGKRGCGPSVRRSLQSAGPGAGSGRGGAGRRGGAACGRWEVASRRARAAARGRRIRTAEGALLAGGGGRREGRKQGKQAGKASKQAGGGGG